MTDLDPQRTEGEHANSVPTENNGSPTGEPLRKNPADAAGASAAEGSAPEGGGPRDDRSGLDRAEEIVDHFADRVSSMTSSWGRRFLRIMSRAREATQDFWAEVQDFRQGKKP